MYRRLERYITPNDIRITITIYSGCKKEEDTAVGVINACQTGTARGVVVSHYRAFLEDLEDEAERDAEEMDYIDYDY